MQLEVVDLFCGVGGLTCGMKQAGFTIDNLNIDKAKATVIPLSPLAEQKRIVSKLIVLLTSVEV